MFFRILFLLLETAEHLPTSLMITLAGILYILKFRLTGRDQLIEGLFLFKDRPRNSTNVKIVIAVDKITLGNVQTTF